MAADVDDYDGGLLGSLSRRGIDHTDAEQHKNPFGNQSRRRRKEGAQRVSVWRSTKAENQ